jgi:hypothetical protein
VTPPPVIAAPQPSSPLPPSAPPAGYAPPSGQPLYPPAPIAPPGAYAPPPFGVAVDRRTSAPTRPDGYAWPVDPGTTVPFAPADDWSLYEATGDTAFDLWQGLLTSYLDTRNVGVSAEGEAFPETTAGDVRRVAAQLSRELCHPRYDLAGLIETRAAWRDALTRANALCARIGWLDVYPENERFWLSDSLALAQRLAAVDARRNAIVLSEGGLLQVLGDRSDPLTTWRDLWHFFRARRAVRTDERGWKYPETTLSDVVQVARVIDQDLRQTIAMVPPLSVAASALRGRLGPWRAMARELEEHVADRRLDETYAGNAAFWRITRRLAIWLSVARDAAGSASGSGALTELRR